MGAFAGLFAIVLVQGVAAPAVCAEDFYWENSAHSIWVSPLSRLVRVEIPSAVQWEGHGRGLLVLTAASDGLIGGGEPWAPVEAGLSLTPPRVDVTSDGSEVSTQTRFGSSGRRYSHRPRLDIFPLAGGDRFEAWTDFRRNDPAAAAVVDRFRREGSVTVELWRPAATGRHSAASTARFDWSDVQALALRARDHYGGCPAP